MDIIKGEMLKSAKKKFLNGDANASEKRAMIFNWFQQCTEVLAYMHSKKVIHKDIHFGNWMVDTTTNEVCLIDFGTA